MSGSSRAESRDQAVECRTDASMTQWEQIECHLRQLDFLSSVMLRMVGACCSEMIAKEHHSETISVLDTQF